jgi:hypothetical protein
MNEETPKPDSSVKSTIDAATGLVKAIPIYQDAIQPSAQQVGKSLETITKTVNIALAPIKALVWGYEQIEEFISTKVSEKLSKIPNENIITPLPQVAGPAIEALRYTGHDENLRELFANLIAAAMNKDTIHTAHPGYVDIIKNLSSDEAILLKAFVHFRIHPIIDIISVSDNESGYQLIFSKFTHLDKQVKLIRPDLIPFFIDNLSRLGMLEFTTDIRLTAPNTYEPLENDNEIDELKKRMINQNCKVKFNRGIVKTTEYGEIFIQNIVKDK